MSMGRRVALLARPGVACDRLRGALAEAGAQVVLEADPLTLDPATLGAAQAQVVMVALDAQTEEALERFETALHDPAIEVIFEEAELAAKREGWEAARWVRHLAAKLHRHDDVLPPGGEAASTVTPGTAADLSASSATTHFDLDMEAPAPPTPNTPHAFDPLLAEMDFDEIAPAVGDAASIAGSTAVAVPSFDTDLDFSYDGSFDPVAADLSAGPGPVLDPYDFDQENSSLLDDPALNEFRVEPAAGSADRGFNQMFDGDFAAAAGAGNGTGSDAPPDIAEPRGSTARAGNEKKQVLELVSADDGTPPALRGYSEPSAENSQSDGRFKHDLASLESRIAGMELVDDRVVKGPAQANGAVLVMAGIGGPDAVRQLLGALPADFRRPVLVQQKLDGGRYDKLVAQMQRATTLPVKLAAPGLPALDGEIYIMPADTGIQVTNNGIQFFGGGDDVLAALPSADSAVLLLSGSDPAQVDAVMNHSWAGALVIGQAPDGCYDAAAANALIARGGACGQPAELAARLADRWRS